MCGPNPSFTRNCDKSPLRLGGLKTFTHIKDISKVRPRRHLNPLFGHIGDEISKRGEKSTLGFNRD